jgi:phenylacetate 2-hydroxylase
MEQLAKISPFETVLEFGRSSSVLTPGTISVVLLLTIWALFVNILQASKIPSH